MTRLFSSPQERAAAPHGLVWLALGTVYVVWGSTYLGIRITVETMPPMVSMGFRFLVAASVLALILTIRHGPGVLRVSPRNAAGAALVGLLLLTCGNGAVAVAETSVPSGLTALIVAAVPLWVVCLRAGFSDRPRAVSVAGVLVGLAGLWVLLTPARLPGGAGLGGALVILGGTLCWANGSFWSGRLPLPARAFVATTYEMLAGGLGSMTVGTLRGEWQTLDLQAISGSSWLALAYLVTFGSLVAFTAYVWLLNNAPISLIATYAYVNPVVAVALGALILSEPITAPILAGGAIVVAGVAIVVTSERPGRAAARAASPDRHASDGSEQPAAVTES
ncbi:MAG: EamA family transporter [Streptomycetales bacterium]